MILAAGFGTRLLPHTLVRPKPLFPILNQPLLFLTIKRLRSFGFDHIIVNCHHLRQQVIDALDGMKGVVIQEEETILGTGGGLRKALKEMRDEPLLVSNGDIYHTVNFRRFYQHHVAHDNLVTLALRNDTRFNTVLVRENRIVKFGKHAPLDKLAFAGLHVINPAILQDIKSDQYSCIIDCYRQMLHKELPIDCYRVDDCFWTDMGTINDYLALHQGLLTNTIPCWQEIGPVRKPYYIAKRAKLPAHFELKDWVCIGEANIENDTHLARVVVWDNVFVPCGQKLGDMIISSRDA